jgi:hypothetical protein
MSLLKLCSVINFVSFSSNPQDMLLFLDKGRRVNHSGVLLFSQDFLGGNRLNIPTF